MKKLMKVFGALLLAAVWVAPGFADDQGSAKRSEPCREDRMKFCGDIKPGDGRVVDCMKAHEADLSPACKERIAQRKEKRQERRDARRDNCGNDVAKLCAGVKPGEGRIISCLKSHGSEVSAACQESMGRLGSGAQK